MPKTSEKEKARPRAMVILAGLLIGLLASAFAVPACDTGGEDDINGEGDADTDTDTDGDTDTDTEEPPYTSALVVTTDYQTGAYSTIALDGLTVTQDINFVHSDAVCHFDPLTGTPFVILRLGADAVDVLDPGTFDIVKEYSVEASSNPHDIEVVSADRAYITRFGLSKMLIVNPMTGAEIGTVDLSAYADTDGIPEISGMAKMNDQLYVTVKRLDRENSWEPVGDSYIVVIDAATGQVTGDIELTGTNPVGAPEYSAALGKFVVALVGSYGTLDDGGVELLDPATDTVGGFIVSEATLGGSLNKTLCIAETKCYAIIGVAGDNGSNTHIVTFNPNTGQTTGTLLQGAGWVYGNIAITPDNTELWIADRTADNAGIRIFDTATDAEKTPAPVGVGLPPSDICFTR